MIAIIDYGVGNIFSLLSSLKFLNQDAILTSDKDKIAECDRIILPGVGAFEDAAKRLRESGLSDIIIDECKKGKPLLGICLGMQLLFDKSYEYGEHEGLGLIKGKVMPIQDVIDKDCKIPHIGCDGLKFSETKHPIFKYINEGDCVYFVHSYYGTDCEESVIASCEYSAMLTAAVADKNVIGVQFHPEKSGSVGLNIIKAFCEIQGDRI